MTMYKVRFFEDSHRAEFLKRRGCDINADTKWFDYSITNSITLAITLLFWSLVASPAFARHPWDCLPHRGDDSNYCAAIAIGDYKYCDLIEHEGKKFTCHARIRFDTNICLVIDNIKDRNYCLNLVRKEIQIKNDYAKRVVREIPAELRDWSGWPNER